MKFSSIRARGLGAALLAGVLSVGALVTFAGTSGAVITGSTVILTPPATAATPVYGGVASQIAAGWTITAPLTAKSDGDAYTFVINPNGQATPLCTAQNDIAFGAKPTAVATPFPATATGATAPTFAVTLGTQPSVEPACSGLANQVTLTVATTGTAGTATAWTVTVAGIVYNVGAGASTGAVDTAQSSCTNDNAALCSFSVPANATVNTTGSDVVVGSNTPPTALLAGADTNQPISPVTFTETVPAAIPAGSVCIKLAGTSVFDTTTVTPTITVSSGGTAITTPVVVSGSTASFTVVTPSTAAATYTLAGLHVDGPATPGPVGFASATSGGTCGTPVNTLSVGSLRAFTVLGTTRTAGADADATAVAEFEAAFGNGPSTHDAVLATDSNYPDALSASYLAGELGTGILLTPTAALSTETADAIRNEGIQTVYVVGGVDAVSQNVLNTLASTPAYEEGGITPITPTQDIVVNQIAGATEYDTSFDIATEFTPSHVGTGSFAGAYGHYNDTTGTSSTTGPASAPTAILATGAGFEDATAASVIGYSEHFPVILTTPTALASQAQAALTNLGIKQVILMGGPDAISDAVVTTLTTDGIAVLRIAGNDYTDTAQELALFELNSNTVTAGAQGLSWDHGEGTNENQITLARGDFYSDALAGSAFAATAAGGSPEPILLTFDPNTVGSYLAGFLTAAGGTGAVFDDPNSTIDTVNVLGGVDAITNATVNAVLSDLAS